MIADLGQGRENTKEDKHNIFVVHENKEVLKE